MKWVTLRSAHINTNNVGMFYWDDGYLFIDFVGDEGEWKMEDPDQELYIQLCRQQGIRPYEEE